MSYTLVRPDVRMEFCDTLPPVLQKPKLDSYFMMRLEESDREKFNRLSLKQRKKLLEKVRQLIRETAKDHSSEPLP